MSTTEQLKSWTSICDLFADASKTLNEMRLRFDDRQFLSIAGFQLFVSCSEMVEQIKELQQAGLEDQSNTIAICSHCSSLAALLRNIEQMSEIIFTKRFTGSDETRAKLFVMIENWMNEAADHVDRINDMAAS